ncbi:hypothetical protein ACTOB_006694 [Actinoplanes oblitus]|uniref:Uncharacterized protein n=1 Tax=Actinoplanes oblitus TaxID=3040509 RepID=A0ABY8WC57_9ACTN|nr:hypothetical protein [Actinoplanes oblitus]WIM94653.1 hypothetical protein ACTOB_006694 [Actinoplanes oblitus]
MRFASPDRPGRRDHRAELRRGLAAGRLPMIGVPGAPGARIDGWGSSDNVLTSVTVRYGDSDSWLAVETARWSGTGQESSGLREVLEERLRAAGIRFADVSWTTSERPVVVDGRTVTARVLHAGPDWWAARIVLEAGLFGEVEVGLTAYRKGFEPRLGILPGAEIADLLDAPLPGPEPWSPAGAAAEPEPPLPVGEPHRVLVDVVLREARESEVWQAEGGPVPRLPASWGALWAAAVRRQSDLAGQPADAADAAITDLLSQLTTLFRDAAWFRADAVLRERAINETLLYATGLATTVPSRPAQQAWRARQDARRPPATAADFVGIRHAEARWLDAWHTWSQRP